MLVFTYQLSAHDIAVSDAGPAAGAEREGSDVTSHTSCLPTRL